MLVISLRITLVVLYIRMLMILFMMLLMILRNL